jgi:hypothetical protein
MWQGNIAELNNFTGHYPPTLAQFKEFPDIFQATGFKFKNTKIQFYEFNPNGTYNPKPLLSEIITH